MTCHIGHNIVICNSLTSTATITGASGREYLAELDAFLGPSVLRKSDHEPWKRQPGPGHEFWAAYEAWLKSGDK